MTDNEKRMRVQPSHWDSLLNFLEDHPELLTGKFTTPNAKQKTSQLWKQLAEQLNAIGLGSKSVEKWKTALQDWKYKTKQKALNIKMSQAKTGGGPCQTPVLTDQEKRLMGIVGWKCVQGDEAVEESGIATVQEKVRDEIFEEVIYILPFESEGNEESNAVNSPSAPLAGCSIPSSMPKRGIKRKNVESYDRIEYYQKQTETILNKVNDNLANISKELPCFTKAFNDSVEVLKDIRNNTGVIGQQLTKIGKIMAEEPLKL